MICVLQTYDHFSLGKYWNQIIDSYKLMQMVFPDEEIEFYYNISNERFVIRIENAITEDFSKAVTEFADKFELLILTRKQSQNFFDNSPPLEEYR